jgi:hypothetical protein
VPKIKDQDKGEDVPKEEKKKPISDRELRKSSRIVQNVPEIEVKEIQTPQVTPNTSTIKRPTR